VTGKELWISPEDGRQHATIPGTTGAGKTTAILSFLANALTMRAASSWWMARPDNKLFKEVLALARSSGARMIVLHLNLTGRKREQGQQHIQSFRGGQRRCDREMVVSQLGEQSAGNDSNGVFGAGLLR